MASRTPTTVSRGILMLAPDTAHGTDEMEVQRIVVDSPAWREWLARSDTTRFQFETGALCFTARRTRRQGEAYWYATRGNGGSRRELALGTTAELTLRRLEDIAHALAQLDAPRETPDAVRPANRRQGRAHGAHGQMRPAPPVINAADRSVQAPSAPERDSRANLSTKLRTSQLLATKLFIPPLRANLLPRPRLLAQLETGLQRPLTILAAPAGWGKTTALAAWCAAAAGDTQVAWVSLDVGDNDLVRFWTYVLTALNAAQSGVAEEALSFLHASQPPAIEAALTLLLNAVAAQPRDVVLVLVLDDFHLVTTESVHTSLAFLLDHLPPQLHLVLAAREDPPLPLARMRVQGVLSELRAADLRFTSEEAAAFLTERIGLPLSAQAVAALETRSEGWIAGLQLAALSLQGQAREQAEEFIATFTGSNRYIVDYLAEEVLARQPPEVQSFLLRTAVLDRLCAPLCEVLLTGADLATAQGTDWVPGSVGARMQRAHAVPPLTVPAQTILEQLDRANLFLVTLDDDRHWYRYHHLFADVLRSWLRQADPGLYAELHRRASAWFEGQDLVEEAVGHALAAADFEQAATLLEQHGLAIGMGGQTDTMLAWLRALPETLMRSRPRLCAYHAVLLFLFGRGQDKALRARLRDVEATVTAYRAEGASEAELRTTLSLVALLRALLAYQSGDMERSETLGREALDLLSETDVDWYVLAAGILPPSHEVTGDVTEVAERALEKKIATARAAGNLVTALVCARDLAALRQLQGRLRAAVTAYEASTRAIAAPMHMERFLFGPGYYFELGEARIEYNDLEEAAHLLRRGMNLLDRLATAAPMVTQGYLAQARLHQARGQHAVALAALDALGTVALQRQFVPELIERGAAARAQVELSAGNLDAAVQWAEASGLGPENAELPFLREAAYLALVRVRIAQGRGDSRGRFLREAERLLERLLADAEAKGRGRSVLEILILRALAQRAHRDPGGALGILAQALMLAAPEGYVRLFADEGAPMAALLTDLIEAAEQRRLALPPAVLEYARFLLGVCRPLEGGSPNPRAEHLWALQPPHAASGVAPMLDPLTERELEVLRLLAEGASNAAIAATLVVTVGTVKKHVFNVCGKLAAQNRTQVVARARALHLL